MRSYMKKKIEKSSCESISQKARISAVFRRMFNKRTLTLVISAIVILPLLCLLTVRGKQTIDIAQEGSVQLASAPLAATSTQKGVISIPTGMVKANPFMPYRDIDGGTISGDVPAYTLVEPAEFVNENSEAARVMDTIVSGILYDKFSPSAILNIEGNDYLVKKGDTVNNYHVVAIMQDSVTVKLGSNVYKAGIGEILTEGTLNHNNVSNLNNKFGGER